MARTVTVKISADTADFRAKLRDAGKSVHDFRSEMDKAARGGHLDQVADQAARMGVIGVGAFGAVVASAAKFQKAMSGVSAATHASARDMEMLRQAALQAGKDTSYSATEAAAAETELAKAGVAVRDVINGGLKGALALAAAGQMDVAEAAETAASAMTQFKLKGADIPHIADLLAAGAGKAQGSVHDMGAALNQAGLVAAQMGLSIEDTTGTLAAFASAGLIGSDAGTSLKTAMLMLANPTDKARSLMQDLGIQVYDAQGKFVGVTKLAGSLKSQLADLTQEQRNSALATIFGSDAIRAASVLYEQGSTGIQSWIGKVNDTGFAADTAARQTDNLVGDLERLKGSLETLAIESGSGANGGLRTLAQGAEAVVDKFGSLPPIVSETTVVLAGLGGAVLLLGAGWVKARRSTAAFLEELSATGPAGTRAASSLQKVASAAGKVAGAFALVQIADMAIASQMSELNPQVDALTTSLTQYVQTGKATGEMARLLGGDLGKLTDKFQTIADTDNNRINMARGLADGMESFSSTLASADDSLTTTRARVTALDQSLAQMVQGGKTDQAKKAFADLAHQLAVDGVSMDEFKAQFPAYAASLEVANSATAGATSATGDLAGALGGGVGAQKEYASAVDASAAAVRGERSALAQLAKQLHAEADPVFGMIDAQTTLTQAQEKAAAATAKAANAAKEHGKDSKQYAKASREAKEATRDLAVAALDLEGKAGALGQTFDGAMTPALRSTLRAAGLTEAQIGDLSGQFRAAKKDGDKFSKDYKAEVHLDGYPGVTGQLDKLLIYQQALKKGISVSAASSAFNKNAKGFHAGGWTGPGDKMQVAGAVHADEFVIRKESRKKIESNNPGLLDEMNATGQVRGYAGGGMVLPFAASVSGTRIPSRAEVAAKAGPVFNKDWPSSPGAQRGDSGIWHKVVALIKSTGPLSGEFGNSYRPGDPKWHGSGRAVDWMGYNQDALASFLASKGPLELIHRSKTRDYAYTRGRNKGSFNNALMEAHRNHVHIAMKNGGVINEHVIGYGRSGATYEFGEAGSERVTPMRGYAGGGLVNVAPGSSSGNAPTGFTPSATRLDYIESLLAARNAVAALSEALKQNGKSWSISTAKGRENRSALISGVRAAQAAAVAKYNETGSVAAANRVYSDYIKQLDAAMKKMGINAKTRRELLKAYSEKPKYDLPDAPKSSPRAPSNSSSLVKSVTDQMAVEEALSTTKQAFAWQKPNFTTKTATGRSELGQLFSFLGAAQTAAQSMYEQTGSASSATALYNTYIAQLRQLLAASGMTKKSIDATIKRFGRITLEPTANRWGGMYERAGGGLRDAQIAAGGPTRYAWAEASTGGEAFIPRRGDRNRSLAIWQHVGEQWLGQPVWRPGQSGGSTAGRSVTVLATIPITLGAETISRQVRFEVDTAIGQVVTATVYQTA